MIGTDPTKHCGTNAWPPDFNNSGSVCGADLLAFNAVHFQDGRTPPIRRYVARFDFNGNGLLNGQDLLALAPFFGKRCS